LGYLHMLGNEPAFGVKDWQLLNLEN